MKDTNKTFIVLIALAVVGTVIGFFVVNYSDRFFEGRDKAREVSELDKETEKALQAKPTLALKDIRVEESESGSKTVTVPLGREGLDKSIFLGFSANSVSYKVGTETLSLPLASEFTLACTEADLEKITEFNLGTIKKIVRLTPETAQGSIKEGEPIAIFSKDFEGTIAAYTIAVSSESCK